MYELVLETSTDPYQPVHPYYLIKISKTYRETVVTVSYLRNSYNCFALSQRTLSEMPTISNALVQMCLHRRCIYR